MTLAQNNQPIEILLVEDNPGDMRLTMEALKLDLSLPRRDDCKILAEIKSESRPRRIPVVVLITAGSSGLSNISG